MERSIRILGAPLILSDFATEAPATGIWAVSIRSLFDRRGQLEQRLRAVQKFRGLPNQGGHLCSRTVADWSFRVDHADKLQYRADKIDIDCQVLLPFRLDAQFAVVAILGDAKLEIARL